MFGAVKTQSDKSVFPIDYRALNREEEYILISNKYIIAMAMDVAINGLRLHFKEDLLNWF